MSDTPTAATLAIGDELLEGRTPDLNSAVVARALRELGVPVRSMGVLGDDEEALARRFEELCARHELVVVAGGLGPTLDDVTRHAAARAAGVPLVEVPRARRHVEEWFERTGVPMADSNLRQALAPEGAEYVHNAAGTAPAFLVRVGPGWLACLPGPPRELAHVLGASLVPRLPELLDLDRGVASADLYLFGLGESTFAEVVGERMDRDADPLVGVSAKNGILHVRLSSRAATEEAARAKVDACVADLRGVLAEWLYSEEEPALERVVGEALLRRGTTVTLAESCTGGLAAGLLTRVPGISRVLSAAWVTYANEAKERELGVPAELLARCGAVSSEVAAAMAEGAARRAGARLAVSVTGIAGPDGGSEEKPVGLVWFGVHADGRTATFERRFPNLGRDRVRRYAALTALQALLGWAEGLEDSV